MRTRGAWTPDESLHWDVRRDRFLGIVAPGATGLNMGRRVEESSVDIGIKGDDLDPEEITALLGAKPTFSCKMGVARDVGNARIVQPTGVWTLEGKARDAGKIEARAHALLDRATQDLERWKKITGRFKADLRCCANVDEEHDMVIYTASLVRRLGERGLGIMVDIDDGESDEELHE